MNSEKSQPTKCENYELSKRSPGQQRTTLFTEKNIFSEFWDQSRQSILYHFLTVFCRQMGYATAQMHHPGCVAAAFRKLNSLRIGLGIKYARTSAHITM
jgi:hypothetical protein